MGDRTYAYISIDGRLETAEAVDDLINIIEAHGLMLDDEHMGYDGYGCSHEEDFRVEIAEAILNCNASGVSLKLYDDKANYGELPEIQDACQRLGLPYMRRWNAGGDYGAGKAVWFPGLEKERSVACDNEASEVMIPLVEVIKASDKGLEAINTLIADFNITCGYPSESNGLYVKDTVLRYLSFIINEEDIRARMGI